jgi:hypothetical protein
MTVGYDGLHYYYGHICRLSTGAGAQYSGYLSHCMSAAIPDLGCATACPSADTDEYMVCCEACCRAASAIKKNAPELHSSSTTLMVGMLAPAGPFPTSCGSGARQCSLPPHRPPAERGAVVSGTCPYYIIKYFRTGLARVVASRCGLPACGPYRRRAVGGDRSWVGQLN